MLGPGNNIPDEQMPRMNLPQSVDGERLDPIGAVVALGLIAIIMAM